MYATSEVLHEFFFWSTVNSKLVVSTFLMTRNQDMGLRCEDSRFWPRRIGAHVMHDKTDVELPKPLLDDAFEVAGRA